MEGLELDFDEWFDLFIDKCKRLDYHGLVDKYSFEMNWIEGETPDYAAEQFVEEMKS